VGGCGMKVDIEKEELWPHYILTEVPESSDEGYEMDRELFQKYNETKELFLELRRRISEINEDYL
jgi:hypothetical protein